MTAQMDRQYITPTIAKEMLAEWNSNNRRPSHRIIQRYARQMAEGNWRDTGQAIIIYRDPEGRPHIQDGQHRLLALVAAGVSLWFYISYVEEPVYDVVGEVYTRSLGQLAGMSFPDGLGVAATASASALAICDELIARGVSYYSNLSTKAERIAAVRREPALLAFATSILTPFYTGMGVRMPVGVLAGLFSIYRVVGEEMRPFVTPLCTGEGLYQSDPIYVLRRGLLARSYTALRGTDTARAQCIVTIRAWNAWVREESVAVLRVGTVVPKVALPQPAMPMAAD